ncbi:hypothetical protein HPP92_017014 [Vanilla planifolia]|uniref:Uncharacterized protein n=1 Tax=Vanilla planifolia TaxID=51239 RepID=A0A835QJ60_VANPL|nr:hypothetical protein HPP92_017014 [Vanilla planifolia]
MTLLGSSQGMGGLLIGKLLRSKKNRFFYLGCRKLGDRWSSWDYREISDSICGLIHPNKNRTRGFN